MSGIDNNWADEERRSDFLAERPDPELPDPSEYAWVDAYHADCARDRAREQFNTRRDEVA